MGIRVSVQGLKALKAIKKQMLKAAKQAGNRALKAMRAEAIRQVRAKKRMKVAQLNKSAFLMIKPKGNDLQSMDWKLAISGAPMPVSAYAVRQTKAGVTAKINTGKLSYLKHAFLAVVGGHQGVFYRKTDARLPIDEAFTTRVSDVFRDNDGTAIQVQMVGASVFATRWKHEFERLAAGTPKTD